MTDAQSDLDPLDRLAEEFVARLRTGEKPTAEEYAARHPELAADIRETFPVLVAMERAKPAANPHRPAVPGYRVLGLIGRGGMGEVYEAVQEALGRRVALKILRPRGRLTDALRERFRREAQAAGRLHHTHIVPVFDSGEAEGLLYFAMQLIPGRGLDAVLGEVRELRGDPARTTAVAAASTLTGTGREYHRAVARLLADAADALAHAHRRGVLHRDVKPSNLLLDDAGAVWVTDFGLAKADDAGDLTDTGDVVGTVRYMAPERFDGRADARSDVYALGLTAYEFATRRPAYDGPADPALVRRILAGPPASPRSVEPTVPRDLETVILKATAANPAHRYPTADELAADLRRFADGLPVTARRVSAVEAAWRAARRNPVVASLAAAVVLVSVVGAGVSGWKAWQAEERADGERRAKQDADAKRIEAEAARADAVRAAADEAWAKETAIRTERSTRAVRDFLQNKLLRQADARARASQPWAGGLPADGDVKVRDLLDRAAAELAPDTIEKSFPDQPLVQAELLYTVGDTYRGVGVPGKAVELLERAVGLYEKHLPAGHRDTLWATGCLAHALQLAGQTKRAADLFERVRDAQAAAFGPTDPDTQATANNLAQAYIADGRPPAAVKLLVQLRDAATDAPPDADTLAVRNNLAQAYLEAGRLADAVTEAERVAKDAERVFAADHPDWIVFRNNLGQVYRAAGRLPAAAKAFTQAIADAEKLLPADHPHLLLARRNLAAAQRRLGQTAEAVEQLERVLKAQTAKLGANHPDTLTTADELGQAYLSARRLPDAVKLLERVRDARLVDPGPTHMDTLATETSLAAAYRISGRAADGVKLLEHVRKVELDTLPPDHPHTLATTNSLGLAYRDAGRVDEAIELFEGLRKACRKQFSDANPKTLVTLGNLGLTYEAAGRPADALPHHLKAADGMADLNYDHENARGVVSDALACLETLGRWDEAAKRRRAWLPVVKARVGATSNSYALELAALGRDLLELRKPADAEEPLRESLKLLEKAAPQAWVTFHTRSMLGGALLGQKKYEEAEPLLLEGYQGMKDRVRGVPPAGRNRMLDAADRLVELYATTNRPDELARWKAERATLRETLPPPRVAAPAR